jgi:DNA-binding response OmpR family regulator
MRVLVVEDNEVVARAVAAGLRDQGIAVDVAGDGAAGLDKAGLSPYDVIVLDRDLPVVHGDDVCAAGWPPWGSPDPDADRGRCAR